MIMGGRGHCSETPYKAAQAGSWLGWWFYAQVLLQCLSFTASFIFTPKHSPVRKGLASNDILINFHDRGLCTIPTQFLPSDDILPKKI